MKKTILKFLLVVLGLSLVSCSTFSKSECENMNWMQAGYDSAIKGEAPGDGIGYYRRECTHRHEVKLDRKAYKQGYNNGLRKFCTPSFARQFGLHGGVYQDTCPQEKTDAFMKEYQVGLNQYTILEINKLRQQISNLKSEKSRLKNRISELEAENQRLKSTVQ